MPMRAHAYAASPTTFAPLPEFPAPPSACRRAGS